MINYNPLWKTMKEKKVSQYRLIKYYGFSSGQINRLKKNQYVSTHTIGVLCTILDCSVEQVMEFQMDNSEYAFPSPEMYENHIHSISGPKAETGTEAESQA